MFVAKFVLNDFCSSFVQVILLYDSTLILYDVFNLRSLITPAFEPILNCSYISPYWELTTILNSLVSAVVGSSGGVS